MMQLRYNNFRIYPDFEVGYVSVLHFDEASRNVSKDEYLKNQADQPAHGGYRMVKKTICFLSGIFPKGFEPLAYTQYMHQLDYCLRPSARSYAVLDGEYGLLRNMEIDPTSKHKS